MLRKVLKAIGIQLQNGTGDANDIWRIEVIGGKPGDFISVVSSRVRFFHQLQNCVLTGTGKQLPKWAYEQMEVACNPNHRDVKKNTYWNIEENYFPRCKLWIHVYFEIK